MESLPSLQRGIQHVPGMLYGAVKAAPLPIGDSLWKVPHRRYPRLTLGGVAIGLLLPWLLFAVTCYVMSSRIHYETPWLAFLVCFFGGCIVLALAFVVRWKWFSVDKEGYAKDTTWPMFLLLTAAGAWVGGIVVGLRIFDNTTVPYNDILRLDNYAAVDPATMRGQSYMDAGRIQFINEAKLGLDMPMTFKNLDNYCVVPIVHDGVTQDVYDFWAIGLNCCSKEGYDPRRPPQAQGASGPFQCGEYKNTEAKSGLRLLRADQREFFRLAVQEAEAAYGIRTQYPIFFYWEQNTDEALQQYLVAGFHYFLMACLSHLCIQSMLLIVTVVGIGCMIT
mmetsp:Transcript_63351/g.151145  ORF Transcript_63351/g.151145 Transcript_63351/m.151145 type:complete len:335 (+) Transcript_63351:139-1143(+)